MTNLEIRLARPEDDEELRRILRENPISGDISLTFEREPNYFVAARVEASDHQIIVAKDLDTRRIVGMGARSIRPLYVNGRVVQLGYLSQFRVDQNYRYVREGYKEAWGLFNELHQDGKSPYYYTSIIEDNLPARRFLTRGLPGMPVYNEYARMHTLALYSLKRKNDITPMAGLKIERGNEVNQSAIFDCLQRNQSRYQFTPQWNGSLLFHPSHTPGLTPGNFIVASRRETVVGCAALWDQGGFKQTVVSGYSNRVIYFRWLINIGARVFGRPILPSVNTKIKHAYLSHLAVDQDDQDIYLPLLRTVFNQAVHHGHSYLMLGLCDHHPLLDITQRAYAHLDYTSILYLVSWSKEHNPVADLDNKLPGPEIAIL